MRHAFPAGGTAERHAVRSRTQTRGPLRAFVAAVLAAQIVGGALAVVMLSGGAPASAATLGQAVETSFGVISVDQVEQIAASNPDRDTLLPGLKEVQVALTMTNLRDHAIGYSRHQVSLRVVGSVTSIPVSSASIVAGLLKPGSAFRIIYRFDIPTEATDLWVQFRDPGSTSPIRVDLGNWPFPVGVSSAYNPTLHAYHPHTPYGGGR